VVEEMMPYLTDFYGNPSSGYRFGQQVGRRWIKRGSGSRRCLAARGRDYFHELRHGIDERGDQLRAAHGPRPAAHRHHARGAQRTLKHCETLANAGTR